MNEENEKNIPGYQSSAIRYQATANQPKKDFLQLAN
jgi:hypothetical protein